MRKLILAVLFTALTAAAASAGVLRTGYKVTKTTVKVGAKVVAKTAKVAYKVAY